METEKLKIVSTDKNLRLCVIENCIFIEETISWTLGVILNIDWKQSKSFGFTSSALSFNQKVHIIMDLKGIETEEHKRFITLMNIRNQFAHNSHIQTFENVFTKAKNGKELRNNFHRWYFDANGLADIPEINHEKVYRLCFYLLVHSIAEILLKLSGDHMYALGVTEGERQANERIQKELMESMRTLNGGKDAIYDIFDKLAKEKK